MTRPEPGQLLNERQAAAFLNLRPATLRGWRYEGTGPEFVQLDGLHIRYTRVALDAFRAARRSRRVRPTGAR
jgi:hypothetical protein